MRYSMEGKLDDLNQAIEYSQTAYNLSKGRKGSPEHVDCLASLGGRLGMRYNTKERKPDDLD